MRVVTQTSRELVLEHRPVIIPAVLFMLLVGAAVSTFRSPESLGPGEWVAAVAGHLVGAFIVYLAAQRSLVTFNGEKRVVTWQHLGWPGAENGSCALDDVIGIRAASDRSRRAVERLELLTTARAVPLTRHYVGFEPNIHTVAAVRNWLEQQKVTGRRG